MRFSHQIGNLLEKRKLCYIENYKQMKLRIEILRHYCPVCMPYIDPLSNHLTSAFSGHNSHWRYVLDLHLDLNFSKRMLIKSRDFFYICNTKISLPKDRRDRLCYLLFWVIWIYVILHMYVPYK